MNSLFFYVKFFFLRSGIEIFFIMNGELFCLFGVTLCRSAICCKFYSFIICAWSHFDSVQRAKTQIQEEPFPKLSVPSIKEVQMMESLNANYAYQHPCCLTAVSVHRCIWLANTHTSILVVRGKIGLLTILEKGCIFFINFIV